MGEVIQFPTIYRLAYTDGDVCEVVAEFRKEWQAEEAMRDYAAKFPFLLFWIAKKGA